jgi:DNA mismatch endonuclease Vsr
MKTSKLEAEPIKNKNMQAVKSSGSQIETMLGKSLWQKGLRYRKNDRTVFGKPDFTLKKYKIAIFADSEFWHGKDWDTRKHDHKSNIDFWHKKIERNIERDKEVNEALAAAGWTVIRFWGKDIKKNLEQCVEIVVKEVEEKRRRKI